MTSEEGIFNLHSNIPYEKEKIGNEEMFRLLELYNIHNQKLNPFIQSQLFAFKAKRKFSEGFYDEAIISIQTNIEILIRITYKEILLYSGVSEIEVDKNLEVESFMSIIKKQLSSYIGGIWDVNKKGTQINNWYEKTYKMRNRIIHGGYYPTFLETNLAMEAAMEFRDFIFKRIRANEMKYPKLNEYFI